MILGPLSVSTIWYHDTTLRGVSLFWFLQERSDRVSGTKQIFTSGSKHNGTVDGVIFSETMGVNRSIKSKSLQRLSTWNFNYADCSVDHTGYACPKHKHHDTHWQPSGYQGTQIRYTEFQNCVQVSYSSYEYWTIGITQKIEGQINLLDLALEGIFLSKYFFSNLLAPYWQRYFGFCQC